MGRQRAGIAGGYASERTEWAKGTQARWARADIVWAIEAGVHRQSMAMGPSRPYSAAIAWLAGASKNARANRWVASPCWRSETRQEMPATRPSTKTGTKTASATATKTAGSSAHDPGVDVARERSERVAGAGEPAVLPIQLPDAGEI